MSPSCPVACSQVLTPSDTENFRHDDVKPGNSEVIVYKLCAGRPSVAPNLSGTNPVHLDFSPYQASIRTPSDNHPTGATARHPRNARPGPAPANVNVTNPIIVSTSSRIAALERRWPRSSDPIQGWYLPVRPTCIRLHVTAGGVWCLINSKRTMYS